MKRAFLYGLALAIFALVAIFSLKPEDIFANGMVPTMYMDWERKSVVAVALGFIPPFALCTWGYLSNYSDGMESVFFQSAVAMTGAILPLATILFFV